MNLIEETLVAWGKYSRSGVLPQSARCIIGKYYLSAPDKDDPISITLEEAERIDSAMLSLKAYYPKIHKVMMSRYYYGNFNDKEVGRRQRVGERTVREWRKQGQMFISGRIFS